MTDWRGIPGFPGYEASDDGRVRSPRCVMKPWVTNGYLIIGLRRDGRTVKMSVGRAMLLAFRGAPDPPLDSCHSDGDKANNSLSNLYWGTRSENILDQVRHGRHNNARKTHCPRGHALTADNIYILSGGRRQCMTCTKASARRSYLNRKAAA